MSIGIQALAHDQVGEICDLFATVYGHPIDLAHWNWKYLEGPRIGSVNLVALTEQGECIGHIGASVFPGIGQKSAYAMAQICDVMVRRDVRGGVGDHSVYPLLVRALQKELLAKFSNVFAYGFPGDRPFRLGERLGFYRFIYRCEMFQISHSVRPAAQAMRWSVRPSDWDADCMDRLWRKHSSSDRPLQVSRTGAYMNWRYRGCPGRTYQVWILRSFFRDVGWLVTCAQPDGVIQVVDALIPSVEAAAGAGAALGRALIDSGMPMPVTVTSWMREFAPDGHQTPIIATEFKVGQWNDHIRAPDFQPGDTDVY